MKCFLIFLLYFTTAAYAQTKQSNFDLKEFIPFASNDLKFDQIVPENEYLYWRFVHTDAHLKHGQEQVVAESGDKKYARGARKIYSESGFLLSCGPGLCYNYIIAFRKDKTVEIIRTDESLKSFIGKVDNIEEIKILARVNRLFVSLRHLNTGSYRKIGDDYLLYLFDYLQSCLPSDGQDEQSVKASLTSNGKFTLIDRTFYNKK